MGQTLAAHAGCPDATNGPRNPIIGNLLEAYAAFTARGVRWPRAEALLGVLTDSWQGFTATLVPEGATFRYGAMGKAAARFLGRSYAGAPLSAVPVNLAAELAVLCTHVLRNGAPQYQVTGVTPSPLVLSWQRLALPAMISGSQGVFVWAAPLEYRSDMLMEFIDACSDGLSIWEPASGVGIPEDFRCLFSNAAFDRTAGLVPPQTVSGLDLFAAWPGLRGSAFGAAMVRATASGRTQALDAALDLGPTLLHARSTMVPVENRVVVTVTNLSEEHRRELALREHAQQFRDFACAAGDWFWETDSGGRVTTLESGDTQDCPLICGQLLGTELHEEVSEGRLVQALAAQRLFRDVRMHTPDRRWIKLNGLPRVTADGQFAGFRGTARDITDLVRKDKELLAARRRASLLEAAVDATPANVTVVDARIPGLPLAVVNRAFCETTGYTAEEVIGRNCRFLQGPETEPEALDAIRMALRDLKPIQVTLTNYRKDGTRFQNELQIAPVRGEGDEVVAFVGVQRDVTLEEERRAAQATRERLEALGRLAGGIAHEINNLLQPMLTLPEGITADLPPAATASREDLATIVEAARAARDILGNFLAFARGDSESRETIDGAAGLRQGLELVAALQPPGITLTRADLLAGTEPSGPITASRAQIMQVLTNLVGNAAQAMAGHGTVVVGLERKVSAGGAWLRLSVADHGHGMDDTTRARIFEPFFTTRAVGQGTGLGLSIVYGIVRSWAGTIEVDSAPGRGTTIAIGIPIKDQAGED